jgi:hypothetical protein
MAEGEQKDKQENIFEFVSRAESKKNRSLGEFFEWSQRHQNNVFRAPTIEANKFKKQLKQFQTNLDQIKGELGKIKAGNIEALALFVALFTFVSIQFQSLINADKANVIMISCLCLGGLLAFISLVILITSIYDWRKVCASVLIFFISSGFLYLTLQKYELYLNYRTECKVLYEQYTQASDTRQLEDLLKEAKTVCAIERR